MIVFDNYSAAMRLSGFDEYAHTDFDKIKTIPTNFKFGRRRQGYGNYYKSGHDIGRADLPEYAEKEDVPQNKKERCLRVHKICNPTCGFNRRPDFCIMKIPCHSEGSEATVGISIKIC